MNMLKLVSVAFLGIFLPLSSFAKETVSAYSSQDNIKYNVIYNCPAFSDSRGVSSGRKFKVLRCDGANCRVFSINEYNPNGGFELDMTKAAVLEDIARYRCLAPGGTKNTEPDTTVPQGQTQNAPPQTTKPTGAVACPASDADSKGKSALEQSFRGAIRESWEREAEPGLDGAVTVTFQAFAISATRRYRVYEDPIDAAGKTIYPVRATFTTCTDYNRRIENTKREREFVCYKNTAGKFSCNLIAAPNTNVKDKTVSTDKPW